MTMSTLIQNVTLAIRTSVPVISTKLDPKTPDRETVFRKEDIRRNAQKSDYDRRHGARDLAPLNVGDTVWIVDLQRQGSVVSLDSAPRSYIITSNGRSIRRNHFHLQLLPSSQPDGEDGEDVDNTPVGFTITISNKKGVDPKPSVSGWRPKGPKTPPEEETTPPQRSIRQEEEKLVQPRENRPSEKIIPAPNAAELRVALVTHEADAETRYEQLRDATPPSKPPASRAATPAPVSKKRDSSAPVPIVQVFPHSTSTTPPTTIMPPSQPEPMEIGEASSSRISPAKILLPYRFDPVKGMSGGIVLCYLLLEFHVFWRHKNEAEFTSH
uniref:Uncharacterized protein n=1 Tax=Strigamia maritima TaxID=126957 RepID=T1JFH8_STRMM